MKILSYNPEDDTFFIGVTKKDFNKIVSEYSFDDDKSKHHLDCVVNETKNSHLRKNYVHMIYKAYGINRFPCIGFIVSRDLKKVVPEVLHHPFHQLWNAYSPWRKIPVRDISSLDELKDIHIECE